jgi:hypothetical protein
VKLFIIFIFLTVSTILSIAQTKFVTEESYREIELGMTLDETEEIFGVAGILDTTLIYIWPDNNLQVEWVEGKIVSYSTTSSMLKEGESNGYDILKEACKGPEGPMTYNQTYEDVVKLLDKEGQKPDWERYLWWVNEYKTIKIVFKDDKIISKQMF